MPIESLPNLGSKSATLLREIGVFSAEDLRELGAVPAYCMLKSQGQSVSKVMLWALHGALTGEKWDRLSAETKQDLLAQIDGFSFAE